MIVYVFGYDDYLMVDEVIVGVMNSISSNIIVSPINFRWDKLLSQSICKKLYRFCELNYFRCHSYLDYLLLYHQPKYFEHLILKRFYKDGHPLFVVDWTKKIAKSKFGIGYKDFIDQFI